MELIGDVTDSGMDDIVKEIQESQSSSSSSSNVIMPEGALQLTPDTTDERTFGTHWGTGDYTGLENGIVN